MNRRSFLGLSAGGLLTLAGCGNEERDQGDLRSTISSLESENSALQTEVAMLQPTEMPTSEGTPSAMYSGTVADRQSFEHDGWMIQSTGYAPMGYLKDPENMMFYFSPDRDTFAVFAFLVTNTANEIRRFSRDTWLLIDELGDVHRARSSSFDRGPVAKDMRIAPGSTEEVWIWFDIDRSRIPTQLVYDDGIAVYTAAEEFPTAADLLPAPAVTDIEPSPRSGGNYRRKQESEEIPAAATPELVGAIHWNDWQITSMEMADDHRIVMAITNVSDEPMIFPSDRLAIIDSYGRWYQAGSPFQVRTDSSYYDGDIGGVELDPEIPIRLRISMMSDVEREMKYLVAIDRSLAIDLGEL